MLRGSLLNDVFAAYEALGSERPTHQSYLHDGAQLPTGNRPWILRELLWVGGVSRELVSEGEEYHMIPRVFHQTVPGGDGRVATLMHKTAETDQGAQSLCTIGVEPDVDFDRKQMSESDMWDIARNVLGG